MSLFKKYILLLVVFGVNNFCSAQDFIFSQYFASQPYLNPSLTGFFDGSYRASANFRNQTIQAGATTRTFGVSYDLGLLKEKLDGDYFGLGVNMYRDETQNLYAKNLGRLNLAFHKKLGYEIEQYLSIGAYLGLHHESLGRNFLPPPGSGNIEEIQRRSISNFDVGLGLNYYIMPSDQFSLFFGVSADHLVPMKNSFFNTDVTLDNRLNSYISSKFLANSKLSIIPSFLFSRQGNQQQINLGGLAQLNFGNFETDKSSFSIGPYFRFGNSSFDAIIAMARLDYKGFWVGLSYDYNLNDLNRASAAAGAAELSVGYIGLFEKNYKSRADCPNLKTF
jgi:type IX secretion system PorP/SprF family membrane protein